METETFFESDSDDNKHKREKRKKPTDKYVGYAGFLAQNLNNEPLKEEPPKKVALPESIFTLQQKTNQEAIDQAVASKELTKRLEDGEDDEDEEEEEEENTDKAQSNYRLRAQPPETQPEQPLEPEETSELYELWLHDQPEPIPSEAPLETEEELESEQGSETPEPLDTTEGQEPVDWQPEQSQKLHGETPKPDSEEEEEAAEPPHADNPVTTRNSYQQEGAENENQYDRSYIPVANEPERTVIVKQELADSLKVGVFTYVLSWLGWKGADRKLERKLNDKMEEHTAEQQAYTDTRFEQLRRAQEQIRSEKRIPTAKQEKPAEPPVQTDEEALDPTIHMRPNEHLEHSAWHNIVVDERGREVKNAIAYGEGWHQERQQELGKQLAEPTTGSSAMTHVPAPQYPSYRQELPSGMTTPALPSGSGTYADPQHQLPAYEEEENRVVPGLSNGWLWLILLLVIAAIVTALLA